MQNKNILRKISDYYSHYLNRDRWFWLFSVSFITIFLFMLIPPIMGSAFRNLKEGDEIPVFSLKDIDGNDLDIEKYKGKIILFNFFTLTKDKSKDALKDLAKIYDDNKDKDVAVIAITSDTDLTDDVKKFRDENGIKFPILIDIDKKAYQSFGIFVMPVTALVDKEFKLVYEYSSHMMGYENEVGGRVKLLLGEVSQEDYDESIKATVIEERSEDEKSAVKKLGQAEILLARGRPDEALTLLEEVVALDPNIAQAHVLLGDALIKKGKFEESMAEYNKVKGMVEKTSPLAKSADVGIGAIHALKGEYDEAKKILQLPAMMNPNPISAAKAYYWLGFIAEKENDLKQAITHYKKAVEKLLEKSKRTR